MTTPDEGPQIDNGNYTRIHNDILEALTLTKFTVHEYKCIFFLLRKTYGWQKKEDAISLSQWVNGTGIYKIDVSRTLKRLGERNVIYSNSTGRGRGATTIYGFNKYFDQWRDAESQTQKGSDSTTDFEWNKGSDSTTDKKGSDLPLKGSDLPLKKVAVALPTKETTKETTSKGDDSLPIQQSKPTPQPTPNVSEGDDVLALIHMVRNEFVYLDRDPRFVATGLVDDYGFKECVRAFNKTKEAQQKNISNGGRGITAPLAYMRGVLRDEIASKPTTWQDQRGIIELRFDN